MKNKQATAFSLTQHPLFTGSVDIVTAYLTAFRDNATQSVMVANRLAKLGPSAEFLKSATNELTVLQAEATARMFGAHQKLGEVMAEQTQTLAKQAEEFKAKFTA
jgi:hypothetical protein